MLSHHKASSEELIPDICFPFEHEVDLGLIELRDPRTFYQHIFPLQVLCIRSALRYCGATEVVGPDYRLSPLAGSPSSKTPPKEYFPSPLLSTKEHRKTFKGW
ncbi:hypothetical protein AVEN_113731-1 [Araneus ventricosus]|uniref:Uncharacterized protein n=1 Tax=Araneus ventricosus TaxID=182803 RepID=A0A4Y2CX92_ARAVE|nr:hypothetical protein AVEN_182846-1 [Araneus ventricosus]GBM08282.1 hypothetical protein AVEN_37273-1 [Araneus ventricosus]GBM08338.1 hypothetical protein AVEN_113731-1 [Araneus ventricosus]